MGNINWGNKKIPSKSGDLREIFILEMRNLGNIYKYLIKLIYNREFIIIHLPNHKEHMGTICCNEENKENASNGVQKKVYASPPTNYQKQLSNREVAGLPAKNSGIACLSEEIHIARHGI